MDFIVNCQANYRDEFKNIVTKEYAINVKTPSFEPYLKNNNTLKLFLLNSIFKNPDSSKVNLIITGIIKR